MTSIDSRRISNSHNFAPGTVRAAWSYRTFRIFFLASALSNVGTWMQNLILPAYIDDRTGSAALVGLGVFTQLGPILLLSIPAGVLADRVDRTRLVAGMQAVMLAGSVTLAALVAAHAPLWTLFATQLAIGVANAINGPSFGASLPMMVERADLPGAVSLNSAMLNGSRIAGPALAAVLSALGVSIAQLFLVNAATYLFLIVPVVAIGLPRVTVAHAERGWRRLTTGINIARHRRVLARLLLVMTAFSLVSLPYIGLFPSVARLNFGIEPASATYKWLYVVWGTGALLGALAVGSWLAGRDRRRLIVAGFTGFAACLTAFALVRSPIAAFPVGFALGFAYFLSVTSVSTTLQQNMSNEERGSVMPLWFMAFGGSIPVGNLIAGPAIDLVGARPVLLVGAGFALVVAWWADLRRLPEHEFLAEPDALPTG
jgi:MFS family permease